MMNTGSDGESFEVDTGYPKKIGITKEQWDEALDGYDDETLKTYSFTTQAGVTKQIAWAGPNVMGAMCAYCFAGPMKLTSFYGNHIAKNKCKYIHFLDTRGKYVVKTKEQRENDEAEMKEQKAAARMKAKARATAK
jgi:hypothetical protein